MPKKAGKQNLEKMFAELEKITADLQAEDLDLETAIEKFEKGLLLSEQLKKRLAEIENKIEMVKLKFSAEEARDAIGEE